jgi:hypothetical protein
MEVPEEGVPVVRALLFILGEVPGAGADPVRDLYLGLDVGLIDHYEVRVQVIGERNLLDGVDVGEQRLHDLSLEVTGLVDELFVVGEDAHAGIHDLHGSFMHNFLRLTSSFSGS